MGISGNPSGFNQQSPWNYNNAYNNHLGQPMVPIYGKGVMTDDFFMFEGLNADGSMQAPSTDSFQSSGFGLGVNNSAASYSNPVTGLSNNLTSDLTTGQYAQPLPAPQSPYVIAPENGNGQWDGIYREPGNFMPEGFSNSGFMDKAFEPGSTLATSAMAGLNYTTYMKLATNTRSASEFGRITSNIFKTLNPGNITKTATKFLTPVKLKEGPKVAKNSSFLNIEEAGKSLTQNNIAKGEVATNYMQNSVVQTMQPTQTAQTILERGGINTFAELASAGQADELVHHLTTAFDQEARKKIISKMSKATDGIGKATSKNVLRRTRLNKNGGGLTLGNVGGIALSAATISLTAKQVIDRFKSRDTIDKIAAGVATAGGLTLGVSAGISAATATTAASTLGKVASIGTKAAGAIGGVVGTAFGIADSIKYFKNGEWERGATTLGAMGVGAAIGMAGGPVGAFIGASIGALAATFANLFIGKKKAQAKNRDKEILPNLKNSLQDIEKNVDDEARNATKEAAKIGNYAKIENTEAAITEQEINDKLFSVADRLSKLKKKDRKKGEDQKILKELEDFLTQVANQKYIENYNNKIEKLAAHHGGQSNTTTNSASSVNAFDQILNSQNQQSNVVPINQEEAMVQEWLAAFIQQNPSMADQSQVVLLENFQQWLLDTGKVAA